MQYYTVPSKDDFDNEIIHSSLILKWSSLVDAIHDSSDPDCIRFRCRQLIRVLDMLHYMEFQQEVSHDCL